MGFLILYDQFRTSVLLICRADRRIHDKNGEIDVLNDRLAEMQLLLEEARKQVDRSQSELVDMREALRLNEASLQAVRGVRTSLRHYSVLIIAIEQLIFAN